MAWPKDKVTVRESICSKIYSTIYISEYQRQFFVSAPRSILSALSYSGFREITSQLRDSHTRLVMAFYLFEIYFFVCYGKWLKVEFKLNRKLRKPNYHYTIVVIKCIVSINFYLPIITLHIWYIKWNCALKNNIYFL